jgi:hypothetical protein
MKIVLRAALTSYRIGPAADGLELTRRRSITFSPGLGARTVLEAREPAGTRPSVRVESGAAAL